MPVVAGFVNPIGRTPAFLVPLFREHAASNRLLVQIIDKSDIITGFDVFNGLRGFESFGNRTFQIEVVEGGLALWAFAFGPGDILLEYARDLRPALNERLRRGELRKYPLLEAEVAAFCYNNEIRKNALRAAYKLLGGEAGIGAGIWRDVVILRPAVCLDIMNLARSVNIVFNTTVLDDVRVESDGNLARVHISLSLFERLFKPQAEKMVASSDLAAVFDLQLRVEARRPSDLLSRKKTAAHATQYPTVYFEESTSRYRPVARLSERESPIIIGPFGAAGIQNQKPSLPGRFIALRNSDADLRQFTQEPSDDLDLAPTVGIIIQRVGFGSSKGSTLRVNKLIPQVAHEDGISGLQFCSAVLFVGGHVLQRSLNVAPDLTASRQGLALARSAASATMALTYAVGARSISELLPQTRNWVVNLAIRRALKRGESPFDAMKVMLPNFLHPEVRLAEGGAAYLVTSSGIEKHHETLREQVIGFSGLEPEYLASLVLPEHTGQLQISLILTNVPFQPADANSFSDFCRQLLLVYGWRVEGVERQRALSGIVARKGGTNVIFTPSVYPESVRSEVSQIQDDSNGKFFVRCIVTNFTPSRSDRNEAGAAGYSIFHYSRLNEWFEYELSKEPVPFGRR